MIRRPTLEDLKVIARAIGRLILGIGLLMLIPLVTAAIATEGRVMLDFGIGSLACVCLWLMAEVTCYTSKDLTWSHGLVVVALGWIVASLVGALPHWLSGHFSSYLDACFDLMSGYTTTGLYLLQDLDHVSHGLNMWRHLLTYAGGQGIIVIALTFLFAGTGGAFKIYAGEGKEEKLLPNVVHTARAIWIISLTYLAVGSIGLFVALLGAGMPVARGGLHATWLFMGSWSTGGFAPQSLNLLYYHSFWIEVATMVIFVIGSFNFALHWAAWTGNRREMYRNAEIISFTITVGLTSMMLALGLAKLGLFDSVSEFFRKGFYNLISGHTTTGNSTIYSVGFIKDFGFVAMWAVIIAMAIGASAASTGGGFKGLRMAIAAKTFKREARRFVSPESAVVNEKVHHIKDIWLDDALIRATFFILASYVIIYIAGALLGIMYGYEPSVALFEAVSAGSNTGLSAGLTAPTMPALMKIFYIFEMWAGRLEFMSILALIGFGYALMRGRWRRAR